LDGVANDLSKSKTSSLNCAVFGTPLKKDQEMKLTHKSEV